LFEKESVMDRREALTYLGGAAAGLAAFSGSTVRARDEQESHPHAEHFTKCARACADCMNSCDSCYIHCVGLVTGGKQDHVRALKSCVDCAELCATAAKLASRHSFYATIACEACAKTCDECATMCEKFPDDRHMAACAKACTDCAAACRDMIKHIQA